MSKVSAVLASSESCLPALQEAPPTASLHVFLLCAHAHTYTDTHMWWYLTYRIVHLLVGTHSSCESMHAQNLSKINSKNNASVKEGDDQKSHS